MKRQAMERRKVLSASAVGGRVDSITGMPTLDVRAF
jgi:hypothetical protein